MNKLDKLWENPRRTLIIILIVAVLLRVGSAFYLGNTVQILPGTFDQLSYHNLALRLLDGHGFSFAEPWWPATRAGEPTAHWSFLYTLYVTAVYALSGSNPLVARLLQAILVGIFMPLLVYRIAGRLFTNPDKVGGIEQDTGNREKISLLAAAITAVYIYFIYYAAALMTESFYITGILWSFDITLQIAQNKEASIRRWLLLGLAIGITVLLRQLFFLFVPFLLLWLWWAARPNLLKLAIPVFIMVLMMVPWSVRNYYAFDQFVILNTNSGYAFYWGNHPYYGTKFIPILPSETYRELLPADLLHLNEAALDSALLKLGIENVLADPGRYLLLSLSRIPSYFQFWPSADSELISNLSRVGSFGIFLPFMLVGLYLTFRYTYTSWNAWLASPFCLIYLFVLVYTGIHVLIWTLIRYRLPLDAFLVIFASLALVRLLDRLRYGTISAKDR